MSTHATFGKYVLLRKLATGGMGEVFLAKQVGPSGFEKLLVIKRILAHHHEKREYLDMFLAEAKLVARLTHGNIIQIHEMGQIDGDYFIAMEYLRGKALRDIIDALRARGQTLPVPYVVDLAMKLCEGLGYAHAARDIRGRPMNIIHRDVNPHNVLISYAGDLKLIDFGIAKSEMASVHTATGTIKGKFVYMSPEQSAADPIDRRSDIFSLGIVLYEMTALENPFVRQNVVLSLEAIQRHPVPPVGEKRPDAGVLQPILDRALHKDPAERYQTCEEMRDDLRELLRLGKVKPAEQDLSIFLHDLFREDIEDEDRLLAEADRATSDDDGYTADIPSVGSSTVDELDDDVTRRGRPLAKDASPPPATPRPISEPPPRTPGPAIRTPVPIRAAPFSDEEPTIAGDLESLAIRSRMKSAAGLPQPEPTGQVLTLIPPEDVAPGTHEGFDDEGEPHTREDRVPSSAPDSIALVPRPQPTADMPAEAPGGIEAPSNRFPEAAFDELSGSGKPYDPRQAETRELSAGRSSVRDFEHADVPDTPIGVSTGGDLDSDRLEAEDPSINLPVYGGSWRRSMVAAAVLVFALTAVAGYWLTRALTEPAAGPAPIPERTGPVPSELAGATPPVEPAPDPSPTPVNTVVPPGEPAEPPTAVAKPEPAEDRVEADKTPPRRSSRSSRAEARRKAREERAAARAARLEAAREAKAKARAAEAEALDRAAERAEAEAVAEAEARARREAEARARAEAEAEAEARARREAEAKAKVEAARTPPKEEPTRPETRTEPKAAPAGRRGILTLRSSAPVQVTHGSSAQGSAPSTILVRGDAGRVSLAGADVGLEIVLEYEVAGDGIRLRVASEPWSIVKHNGISLGKTPQGPVEAGRRHRFSFLRPGLPEPVVVSLVWNPSSP